MVPRPGSPGAGAQADEPGVVARLAWGLRTWWWIAVAVLPAVLWLVVGRPLLDEDQERYEASSLVVAQQLAIRPEQLPRLGEAVFASGAVAEAVSEAVTGDVEPDEFVPRFVDIEPVLDTVAFRVIGRASDPEVAAGLADNAALAFVQEMNEAGPGVGFFAIQDDARVPDAPVSGGSSTFAIALGVAASAAFALGVIGLVLTVRRPVIHPAEAAGIAGAPVLGTLVVPRVNARSSRLGLRSVVGLDALGRRLFPRPKRVALVGAGGDDRISGAIAGLIAAVVRPRMRTRLVEPLEPRERTAGSEDVDEDLDVDEAVLVHVPGDRVDAPQLLDGGADVVVVVPEGCPRSALERVTSQFVPGALSGVVYVSGAVPRAIRRRAAAVTAARNGRRAVRRDEPAERRALPAVAQGGAGQSGR